MKEPNRPPARVARKRKTERGAIEVTPIGIARTAGQLQAIEVFPEYREALQGIGAARELQVLYWMHRLSEADRRLLTVHPQGDTSRPKRGVFALRSPMRPNPIGSTTVNLVKAEGNRLLVRGLDALDGSPVIDIKIVS